MNRDLINFKLTDKFTGKPKTQGPQVVSLREKLEGYKGTFFIRRLQGLVKYIIIDDKKDHLIMRASFIC
jgi:hypothetical protein